MTEKPFVAVVTLNWNGVSFLEECVDSILASDYDNFHVVVVDNGSRDGSIELLEALYGQNQAVTIVANQANLGYSRGMNVGLKHGFMDLRAEYCLVMNNDTRLDRHAIPALVDVAAQDDKIAFTTGKVYYYDAPDTFQTVGKKAHPVLINGGHIGRGEKDSGQYDEDRELAFCDDIFWLVSKAVYQHTGGYDPDFFLQCEDFDWQLRAKRAGYKIWYAHRARIWHKESMTLGKSTPRKAFYDARNPLVAVMKNCDREATARYLKAKVGGILLPALVKKAVKGEFLIAFALLRGLISSGIWRLGQATSRSTGKPKSRGSAI